MDSMIGAKYILPSGETVNEDEEEGFVFPQNVLPPIGTGFCYKGGLYRVKDVFYNASNDSYGGWWVVLEDDPAGDPRKAIDPGYYK